MHEFIKMDSFTKYFWLLKCENVKILHELASFIHLNLDK